MAGINLRNIFASCVLLLILSLASNRVFGEIIDDINLSTGSTGEVDAAITFTVPIQKLRYFPKGKSKYLIVYFNIVDNVSRDQWQDYEATRSPPSDLIVGFTVTTKDLNTGPKIEIQFNQPVEYRLTGGRDGRSLKIHIRPEKPLKKIEAKALPPIKHVAGQLGGKDGLPIFPKLEQVDQLPEEAKEPENAQATIDVPLEDLIRKTNTEAAAWMAKGRDALLAGEMFAAIQAFNNVLKLPPNKYSADAQCWIGIAREKTGQQVKAKLEYETYLKLYPTGAEVRWVKNRLAILNRIIPAVPAATPTAPAQTKHTEFQFNEYGSFSMYYYHGSSHTDSITTVGGVETPSSLTVTDQSTLISNVSMTSRFFNDEFDNRLVFQDFFSKNFLHTQESRNRLNAAFFETRNRLHDYSARIGRQSATGGGVLGRFDGVSGGYGFVPNWRINAVVGQLSDYVVGDKPKFYGASVDFGVRSPLGGNLYGITQTVGEITDRKAVGGNLRYFEQGKTLLAMADFDTQFKRFNMWTIQGTYNGESTDYNLILDRRRTPSLSIRNAINGTTSSIEILLQNGWTIDDLIKLAKQRTQITNTAQIGATNHLKDKWQLGTDLMVTNTTGLDASGTLLPDGTTGLEGFVPASPASGNTWTISERLIGSDVIASHDVSLMSLSYTKSKFISGTTLMLNNHAFLGELWTFDTTLRFYWQKDSTGGRQTLISPVLKLGYRVKNNLTLETEGGLESTKAEPNANLTSKTLRKYYSVGFRLDF